MLRVILFGSYLMLAGIAAAQTAPNNPNTMPMQPGQPGQSQGSMPGDPNTVPLAPPTFAPGVGAADDASPSAQHKVLRVSAGVMASHVISKVDPVFPEAARKSEVNGTVTMAVRIGTDGHVQNVSVISGPELLRRPYMDAVKQWRYRPYELNGQTVPVDTYVTVSVQLNNGDQATTGKH